MNKIVDFLGQVRSEVAKIEWPKKDEFLGSTLVTLFMVLFFTVFIGLADKGLGYLARQIFTL